jgi:hypothetical protein
MPRVQWCDPKWAPVAAQHKPHPWVDKVKDVIGGVAWSLPPGFSLPLCQQRKR